MQTYLCSGRVFRQQCYLSVNLGQISGLKYLTKCILSLQGTDVLPNNDICQLILTNNRTRYLAISFGQILGLKYLLNAGQVCIPMLSNVDQLLGLKYPAPGIQQ